MNKVLLGLIVGAVLGAIDGATAWFEPAVRPEILTIIFFSTIKGIIGGIAAGWFARKVQSVPAGIAFGFFVGLLLAFLVAMNPDPKTGEHYWWQIMLPGSVLGGVVGWATQRYGKPAGASRTAAASIAIVFMLFAANVQAAENAAFEKLKTLAGTWDATMLKPDGDKTKVEYRITANGSVIMETMFAGSDHEMINMFTIDADGGLMATHYCSAGNQPVLKLNAEKSTANELVFDYVSRTGANKEYINGVRIRFENGKAIEEWSSSRGGDKMTLYLNARQ